MMAKQQAPTTQQTENAVASQPKTETQKAKHEAEVVEYPTQTARTVRIGDNAYDEQAMLALIYNELQEIKKAVC